MERLIERFEDGRAWLESRLLGATNPLFYRLRGALAFRRAGYREDRCAGLPVDEPLATWVNGDEARRASDDHALRRFAEGLAPATWAASVRVAHLLASILDRVGMARLACAAPRALDIGSRNFDYAPGLFALLERRAQSPAQPALTGIEIDAFRVYRTLHSRHDVACYYLSQLPGGERRHRFIAGDLLDHTERYDFITWFKPFLTPYPILRFGLPGRLLQPERLLRHMLARLSPGGVAIIVNQNEYEDAKQRGLLTAAGARCESFVIADPARPIDHPAFAHVLRA